MAALPKERLVSGERAFFVTRSDLFGPIFVTEFRKKIKRWGCLFVCFTMRAVHLEMCYDMSCDSFLNAFFPFFSVPAVMSHVIFGVIRVLTLQPGLKRCLKALEMLIGKALLINGVHVVFIGALFLLSCL